ncbi:L-aspartate oxidase [Klebsiella michiganensis]|nr:L-aspartate oxidase [Klebsiella michiganensis]MBZ6600363.1 L-aspartate oxidase [Klebsiella michiganensis]MBZ7623618.1 L-aspartate oxidase [Klebsiella michiganensis]
MTPLCLVLTTLSKKNVRFLAGWCYCSLIVFSKLNKDHENNFRFLL